MLTIVNRRNYNVYILKISAIVIGVLLLLIVIGKASLIGGLLFGLMIEIIILSNKFIAEVIIHNGKIEIKYYRWLKLFYKEVDIADLDIKESYRGSLRSPKEKSLKLFYKKKQFVTIDTTDGFMEDDLKEMHEYILSDGGL